MDPPNWAVVNGRTRIACSPYYGAPAVRKGNHNGWPARTLSREETHEANFVKLKWGTVRKQVESAWSASRAKLYRIAQDLQAYLFEIRKMVWRAKGRGLAEIGGEAVTEFAARTCALDPRLLAKAASLLAQQAHRIN